MEKEGTIKEIVISTNLWYLSDILSLACAFCDLSHDRVASARLLRSLLVGASRVRSCTSKPNCCRSTPSTSSWSAGFARIWYDGNSSCLSHTVAGMSKRQRGTTATKYRNEGGSCICCILQNMSLCYNSLNLQFRLSQKAENYVARTSRVSYGYEVHKSWRVTGGGLNLQKKSSIMKVSCAQVGFGPD